MTTTNQNVPPEPRVWSTLKQDFKGFRNDVRDTGWSHSAGRTLEDLQTFYLSDEHRKRLRGMHPFKRWFTLVWWLLKALFFKLTPARRVLLVVALWLSVSWRQGFSAGGGHVITSIDTSLLGALLLLLLLALELKDKLLARHELEAGRAVQHALMPPTSPAVAGWDGWLYTRPANDVGGDMVDHLEVEPGRHAIALADVAGKALPAALLMARVQATLRALATEASSPRELVARANTILCRDGLPNRFTTLVYLDVRNDSGTVRLVNAGHMPPLVVTPARFHELSRGGMAMGLFPRAAYEEQDVELRAGEMLVVYSDGITEAMNEAGDFYGDERLRDLMRGLTGLSAAAAGERLLSSVDAFIGDARPYDDISLVILKRCA